VQFRDIQVVIALHKIHITLVLEIAIFTHIIKVAIALLQMQTLIVLLIARQTKHIQTATAKNQILMHHVQLIVQIKISIILHAIVVYFHPMLPAQSDVISTAIILAVIV
jgi:hypothetical protein